MLVCGLTGGIGCGKSTVSASLREDGLAVIDLDDLGHSLLEWPSVRRAVRSQLGADVMCADGRIERKRLSALVFSSAEKRRMLNRIIHPRMLLALLCKLAYHFACGTTILILDAPLLFETGEPHTLFSLSPLVKYRASGYFLDPISRTLFPARFSLHVACLTAFLSPCVCRHEYCVFSFDFSHQVSIASALSRLR